MKKSLIVCVILISISVIFGQEDSLSIFNSLQERIIKVSDIVKQSVVYIEAVQRDGIQKIRVQGSGILLGKEGYIITNEHVVRKSNQADITIMNVKEKFVAEIIGVDQQTDVALLKIKDFKSDIINIDYPKLGNSDNVRVGEWVVAVGNPYGLDGTVSFGIVSAKGRNLQAVNIINEFLQTDASIDPGSSGGPLVNLEGDIIGINSRAQGRGIGFTIPVNVVKKVIDELKREKMVVRGWLGISLQEFNRDFAAYFGCTDVTGVLVNGVFDNSPAEKIGLKPGDIITSFNNKNVVAEKPEELNELKRIISKSPLNKEVPIEFIRDKKNYKKMVKLIKQPKIEPDEVETDYGFTVKEITPSIYRFYQLETKEGVIVSEVDWQTAAADGGLQQSDVILKIDFQKIKNLADFRTKIKNVKDNDKIMLTVMRGRDVKFLLLKPGEFKKLE